MPRCLEDGVGSQLPGCDHWRSLDNSGKDQPHQLSRAASCLPSSEVLCPQTRKYLDPSSFGQHNSDCFPKQNGRSPLNPTLETGSRGLELVHRKEHDPFRTPSGYRKHSCGLGITSHDGFQRLETSSGDISAIGGQVGSLFNRHVRVTDECPTTTVLQLEARPTSRNSRCPLNLVEGAFSISVSTVCPHSSLPGQTQRGEGDGCPDSSGVAKPDLVPTTTQELGRPSNHAPSYSEYRDQPRGSKPPNGHGGSPSAGRLACLRRSYRTEGLSDRVIDIIRKSWRLSTESAYSSSWRQWDSWCLKRNTDPLSAPVSDILEFLLEQFETGKQYRTINTIRSAISMTQ